MVAAVIVIAKARHKQTQRSVPENITPLEFSIGVSSYLVCVPIAAVCQAQRQWGPFLYSLTQLGIEPTTYQSQDDTQIHSQCLGGTELPN